MTTSCQQPCLTLATMPQPTTGRSTMTLLLMLASVAVFAQGSRQIQLPETYRTPLSDIVTEDNPTWRAAEEPENPWRQDSEVPVIDTDKRARFFPQYDYDEPDDPGTRSLFQNEYELERPRTNIFQYKF